MATDLDTTTAAVLCFWCRGPAAGEQARLYGLTRPSTLRSMPAEIVPGEVMAFCDGCSGQLDGGWDALVALVRSSPASVDRSPVMIERIALVLADIVYGGVRLRPEQVRDYRATFAE